MLLVTSLPSLLAHHHIGVAGLAASMVLLGLGTGAIKAVVAPFIGDQYTNTQQQLMIRKDGQKVVVDRALTLEYVYNVLYW